jgi:hypothetical protein
MDWIRRNKSLNSNKIDDSALQELMNVTNISMPQVPLIHLRRKKMAEASLRWLRRNDPTVSDVNDATLSSLAKVCGVPAALTLFSDPKTKAKRSKTYLYGHATRLSVDASVQAFVNALESLFLMDRCHHRQ